MAIEFVEINGGASFGVMVPLAGVSSAGYADYGGSAGIMAPMTGTTGDNPRGNSAGVMAPLAGLSGRTGYADSRGTMAPMEGLAYSGLADPGYTIADTVMQPLIGVGIMMSGTIGQSAGAMRPLIGLAADHPYGEARAALTPLEGFSGELSHGLFALDPRETRLTAGNTRTQRIRCTSSSSGTLIIAQEHVERQGIRDPRTTRLTAQASNRHRMVILSEDVGTRVVHVTINGVPRTLPAVPELSWCFNADTYAASRLEHHQFNSFVAHQGRYYSASDEGIFELGGEDYDGVPIDAFVAFGRQLLGSEQTKQLVRAYLAGESQGLMSLAVQDDKGTTPYRYPAEAPLTSQAETRVIPGRGLQSTYYRLALTNQQGKDFRLDFVRMLVQALSRRFK